MHLLKFHFTYKGIQRLRQILSVFIRHGFYPLIERVHLHRVISFQQRLIGRKVQKKEFLPFPVRLRLAFEELGPTFIKLGQILSTRPDMLSEDFIRELLKLQDNVPPFPYEDVVKTIEEEFNVKADMLFKGIEKEPVAAASIAQVHNAVTTSGDEVVIKVQRPDIQETILQDILILRYIAKQVVKYMPESSLYGPVGMVDEFSKTILREMDFTLEASYIEKFRKNFTDDKRIVIPEVYWELTAKKVLTLERIEGIKVNNIEKLNAAGIDAEKIALLLVSAFFKQIFEHGIFHGDLHSGNIFVLGEERVALVDFGIVGRVSREMKGNLEGIFVGLIDGDCDRLIAIYSKMGLISEDTDIEGLKGEYQELLLRYFGRPFKFARLGEIVRDYIRISSRYRIRMPRDLLLLDKCIFELEGLGRLLYPDIDILKEGERFAKELMKREAGLDAVAGEVLETAMGYKELVNTFPGYLTQIFKKMVNDRFTIDFMHRGLENFIGEIDRSFNRITSGIIISSLILGSSLVMTLGAGPTIFGLPFFGILGFVLASVLGLWLGIVILKSGKF